MSPGERSVQSSGAIETQGYGPLTGRAHGLGLS